MKSTFGQWLNCFAAVSSPNPFVMYDQGILELQACYVYRESRFGSTDGVRHMLPCLTAALVLVLNTVNAFIHK